MNIDYNSINRISKNAFDYPHPGNYSSRYTNRYFKRFTSIAMVIAGVSLIKVCWDNFIDAFNKPSEYSSRNNNGFSPRNDRRGENRFNNNYRNNNNNRNFQRR